MVAVIISTILPNIYSASQELYTPHSFVAW